MARVSLARIARHEDFFRAHYLHAREEGLARALPHAKRRVDFVAGRVAAKRAFEAAGCVLPSMGKDEGRPLWVDDDGTPRTDAGTLSISHGEKWAVAACAPSGVVGIDVETIEPRAASFLEEVFAPGELERVARAIGREATDAIVVTSAWCLKEALLKIAGTGLRVPFPAMVPRELDLPYTSAPGEPFCWGHVRTDELGPCSLAIELAAHRVLALAWRP